MKVIVLLIFTFFLMNQSLAQMVGAEEFVTKKSKAQTITVNKR